MTHRQVLEALSGLLLGMFVSMLASTVVSTSLPVIIHDLGGTQAAFTWVVTATLLTTAISTPIWGKLADLFNRKLLIQIAIAIFVLATAAAGFSQSPEMLIAFRAVQGIGAGGLAALSQVIMADIISPRERGRYMGLFGAVMAVAHDRRPAPGRRHHRHARLALELLRRAPVGDGTPIPAGIGRGQYPPCSSCNPTAASRHR